MNNKIIKNLIVISAFVIFLIGNNNVFAYGVNAVDYNFNGYSPEYSYVSSSYNNNYVQPTTNFQQPYNYNQQPYRFVESQVQYAQQPVQYVQPQVQYLQQPVQYVQPQVQYLQQPVATQQIKYVQPQVQYVEQPVKTIKVSSTQGASVLNANTTKVKPLNTYVNSGSNSNTGAYLNFDNNPNLMVASAYGSYNQPMQQVVTDDSGLTALSIRGSGSFMPSSVFQWFLVILLILGIVIIARMISKTFNRENHTVSTH